MSIMGDWWCAPLRNTIWTYTTYLYTIKVKISHKNANLNLHIQSILKSGHLITHAVQWQDFESTQCELTLYVNKQVCFLFSTLRKW